MHLGATKKKVQINGIYPVLGLYLSHKPVIQRCTCSRCVILGFYAEIQIIFGTVKEHYVQSWALDNTAATTGRCFQANTLLIIAIYLLYIRSVTEALLRFRLFRVVAVAKLNN